MCASKSKSMIKESQDIWPEPSLVWGESGMIEAKAPLVNNG